MQFIVTDWEIRVERVNEDMDYRREYEQEVVDSITETVQTFGEWAWCAVWVKVAPAGLSNEMFEALCGVSHLGGCSYRSKEDFILNSGYYADMVEECKEFCTGRLTEIFGTVSLTKEGAPCPD